jgi:hypothetical protein
MSENALYRFFGGSPVTAIIRLVFVSLVVGAILMWLDIEPLTLILAAEHLALRIWAMGFDAVRELGRYVVAGALIVVPIWFVTRLFSMRSAR